MRNLFDDTICNISMDGGTAIDAKWFLFSSKTSDSGSNHRD